MPFCPQCRSEYVEGVSLCSDCQSELVSVLPPRVDPGEPNLELVEVWRSSGELDAQLVHSLLQSCGIESFLHGEAIRFVHGFNITKLGEVRIMVRSQDQEAAKRIIAEAQLEKSGS